MVTVGNWVKAVQALSLLLVISGCQSNRIADIKVFPKERMDVIEVEKDSMELPFLFYPERWFLTGNNLYVLNSEDSPFLTIYDLNAAKTIKQWGTIGNGPEDYVIPSLSEMNRVNSYAVYSNGQNKMDVYHLDVDSLIKICKYHFPIWNKERGIPKAYTRMQQLDDTLFVGTSFMPKEIAVDLIDMKNERIIDSVDFLLKPSENSYANPYECKVSVGEGRMVIAYRYVNRLEVYHISSDGFALEYVIGDDETQETLCNLDRDDEMILYYSDVICGRKGIYALFKGVQDQVSASANSQLEIYDLNGKVEQIIDLKQGISSFVLDENLAIVYGYDKLNPSNRLYKYKIKPTLKSGGC